MRSVIAQFLKFLCSRSIRYSQQARNFSSSHPASSSESKGAWWYITRALAAAAGYGILGPLALDSETAKYEKIMKQFDEALDREEKMISSVQKS